jgi:hypothetical protein
MTMYRALGEMPLPQVVALGSDVAIVDRPNRHMAAVVFARDAAGQTDWDVVAADVSATIRSVRW